MRFGVLLSFAISVQAAVLMAQQPALPTVTVSGAALTPKLIGKAFERVLAAQKFKASASSHRIVLTQSRGRLPQATGEIVTVQLEVGVRLEQTPAGYTLTVVDETLVADRGGFDQRRPEDLGRNAAAYQGVLDRVKRELEGGSAGSQPTDTTQRDTSVSR